MTSIKYQSRIDGLRFVAVFMVLIEHYAFFIGRKITAGFYGVNLFFVISGFLITYILISGTVQHSFKRSYFIFLGRRALRIFPIYYLCVVLIWFLGLGNINEDIFYLVSYTYNYHLSNTNSWNNIYSLYWSLSVEEQFYLLFPLIVIALRDYYRLLVLVCFSFLILAGLQILIDLFSIEKYNYVGLLSNMWPLIIGALGAILWKENNKFNFIFRHIIMECAVLITLLIVLTYSDWTIRILICPLLNIFLVLKAYNYNFNLRIIDRFLCHPWIIYTGRISYGIYVYHSIIGYLLTKYLFDPIWKLIPFYSMCALGKLEFHSWVIKLPLYTVVSIIIAALSYKHIEMPFLKLKEHLFPVQRF